MSPAGPTGPEGRAWCRWIGWFGVSVGGVAAVACAVTSVSADPQTADDAMPAVLTAGRASITVQARGPTPDVGSVTVVKWIRRSAAVVQGYFGEFPVSALTIRISTGAGGAMGSGKTFGYPALRIEVNLGQHVSPQSLDDDWVLVHEMTHLALPATADEQNWFAEGVATYVEGIARVQGGNLSEASLWSEYVTSLPKGLPQSGDRGLDRTHTWGRTYWGGALYCFVADVQIRSQTHNNRGLQDALRAIARAGAGMAREWPMGRIVSVGDTATGTSVMTDLYRAMKDAPVATDLDALWRDLGVEFHDGVVRFDDTARLSDVRRAITRAPQG